ncbi:5-bromo-4-chloroindolyl phosphate hydrolysis family protein [Anaerococcus sp. AGMB00486]|uniref:5-bromo-4-chloroindolyl phosphate hydrolysis family protein n=2 Tax=Anaerococcus TaxID=165779 RepID=A0ABX2NCM1_9FIRM|nr:MULTISPECIES: 5-bromo-4-chloroindolyl phosphate hydrolysis family protein [Anaerococcus]MDY3005551.1 5-bromo-4-chloroindolyl phosphate hydrolysis family protein [Anaerococcus porci]MSS78603.1 hypothetical protein [Anaerococcus porci]NVF12471.1 5-bromo-4-chloroindolyl phosphate hydrolysis family protein [Anaerococcus faecalis]
MNNLNEDNEKSLENSLNKAIADMDFSNISEKVKNSLDNFIENTINFVNKKSERKPVIPIKDPMVCVQKPPEKSKSSFFKTFSGISAFTSFGMLISILDDFSFSDFNLFVLFTVVGIGLYRFAKRIDIISKDYERFIKELGNNTVISIRDLASAVQKSEKDTIKELLYMMDKGYFKQARIVENDSLFLLDIPTFNLYKNQNMKLPKENIYEKEKLIAESAHDDVTIEKAEDLVKSSNQYLSSIKLSISRIENRAFLEKVIELKKTIQNIINIVKRYPEKAQALDKFMNYYLPTTVKLIDAYTEYEIMGSDEKDILSAMKEIDSSIFTINEAFEKIQLELLEDRTMDIKTDIDTMKLLLNQEGYLKKDWSKNE